MDRKSRNTLRDDVRDRLREIAERATQARRMNVRSDNLCDLLDEIDNEVQAVIGIVNQLRQTGDES
jgi:hypothetical protein